MALNESSDVKRVSVAASGGATTSIDLDVQIPIEYCGRRLDHALAELYPAYSRSCLQQWIRAGQVQLDGCRPKVGSKLYGGERVAIKAVLAVQTEHRPQPITLNIIYADEHLLVIDKPAGLVMHPAAGNCEGTLLNGLLHFDPAMAKVPRAGIVHRLDKDTSGLVVVARTLTAHSQSGCSVTGA